MVAVKPYVCTCNDWQTRAVVSFFYKPLYIDTYSAEFIYLNFHPPEAVSRGRDPQLQVGDNY